MARFRKIAFAAGWLLAALCAASVQHAAHASGFTAFAEDEDACRTAGAAAIDGASGPAAAQRYDRAYRGCMAQHWRRRAYAGGPPGPDPARGNPHGFEYPDAFYSVPYATPGYGYDGFSGW